MKKDYELRIALFTIIFCIFCAPIFSRKPLTRQEIIDLVKNDNLRSEKVWCKRLYFVNFKNDEILNVIDTFINDRYAGYERKLYVGVIPDSSIIITDDLKDLQEGIMFKAYTPLCDVEDLDFIGYVNIGDRVLPIVKDKSYTIPWLSIDRRKSVSFRFYDYPYSDYYRSHNLIDISWLLK